MKLYTIEDSKVVEKEVKFRNCTGYYFRLFNKPVNVKKFIASHSLEELLNLKKEEIEIECKNGKLYSNGYVNPRYVLIKNIYK